MRAESLPVSAFGSPRALIRCLQEKAGLAGARLRGAQGAGFGLTAEPGSRTEDAGELLARWIGAGVKPLVILLDEAHAIEPPAGRAFFDGVQEAATRSLPFLLLTAGTPDAPRQIRKAGTYTERALRRIRVGRLARGETIRALAEPTRDSGLPLCDDAAAFLAAESQDYPYFVQLLGSAAWRAAAGAGALEITMDAAGAGTGAVRSEIETFYSERFREARGCGVHRALAPLAALVSERGGELDDDALDGLLARESPQGGEAKLLHALEDLGVLWETDSGVWEMGIPSFAEHILNRRPPAAPAS